jgi:XRE family transcriptional regulator, regulator of sulfur utilization
MVSDKNRQAVLSAVARILREERLRRGLSLSALAATAGLSHQMVSFVEKEMRNPTLDTLLRIAAALEIDLAEIICQAQSTANNKSK